MPIPDPQKTVERLKSFQAAVRDMLIRSRGESAAAHAVSRSSAADTIYQIDTAARTDKQRRSAGSKAAADRAGRCWWPKDSTQDESRAGGGFPGLPFQLAAEGDACVTAHLWTRSTVRAASCTTSFSAWF